MYFSDNNVQYRVSKYDLSTGQYTELWTYTGDDRVDVFGENTGKVDSMSDGSYVRMDSNGNFYIMTSSTGNDNDTLIKVNFDKNTSEVIYTTDMEKLYSLQSDGEYLYFFESTQSRETKSYFTAIDMNGTLKAQYEMEYDEEFLEKAKNIMSSIQRILLLLRMHQESVYMGLTKDIFLWAAIVIQMYIRI